MKPGDIIKVDKKYHFYLEDARKRIENYRNGLNHFANMVNKEEKEMWDFLYEIYPAVKDYRAEFKILEKEIVILGKHSIDEKKIIELDRKLRKYFKEENM